MHITTFAALLLVFALCLTGCFKPGEPGSKKPGNEPGKTLVLDPTLVKEVRIRGWQWNENPGQAISSDGKYALAVCHDGAEIKVAAFPLGVGDESPAVLASVDMDWAARNYFGFHALGWLDADKPIFIASGPQNQGPNKGKQGISIMTGDVSAGNLSQESGPRAHEISFIECLEGDVINASYFPAKGKVFVVVTGTIWSLDLKTNTATALAENLPPHDELFYASLSPDGAHYLYVLHQEDKAGVFLLDTSTGKEKLVLPRGETVSFYPYWSPDGKYVAVYTAARKPGGTGTDWDSYQVYPGQDSPQPVADKITVFDVKGNLVRQVSLEDKVVGMLRWSRDSKSLAFQSAPVPAEPDHGNGNWSVPEVRYDGLWTAGVEASAPTSKLADLPVASGNEQRWVYPLAFDAQSSGVFYQVGGDNDWSVWYAAGAATPGRQVPEASPVKVADGIWQFSYEQPVYGDYVATVISDQCNMSLWLMKKGDSKSISQWRSITAVLLAYNEDSLLIFRLEEDGPGCISVYSMYKETSSGQ